MVSGSDALVASPVLLVHQRLTSLAATPLFFLEALICIEYGQRWLKVPHFMTALPVLFSFISAGFILGYRHHQWRSATAWQQYNLIFLTFFIFRLLVLVGITQHITLVMVCGLLLAVMIFFHTFRAYQKMTITIAQNTYNHHYRSLRAASSLHNIAQPIMSLDWLFSANATAFPAQEQQLFRSTLNYLMEIVSQARVLLRTPSENMAYFPLSAPLERACLVMQPTIQRLHMELQIYDLANIFLLGDALIFEQIIINLLQNSCEAHPAHGHGHIVITAIIKGRQLRLIIQDNGVGMTPQQLRHIGQIGNSQKPHGTGLGTSFVIYNMQNHFAGRCRYSAHPNQGTTVTLSFPRYRRIKPRPEVTAVL
jgi:signal transduction histidine kinase